MNTVGSHVTLQRGTTYRGDLVGKPGPALLGLGSIVPGGGFRANHWKTFGGECPEKLTLGPRELYVALKGATKDGSMIGSVARVPPDIAAGRLTQDTAKLVFRDRDPEFATYLYWLLRTPHYRSYCAGRATGTTAVGFDRADFLAYPVPPMTPVSRRLVALFEAIENKIELNRQMQLTLESISLAIFRSWFIEFAPVHEKTEGTRLRLTQDLADAFPNDFRPSSLGPIPGGWTVATIGEFASLDRGVSYKGAFLDDAGTPMINLGCFLGAGRFAVEKIKGYSGACKACHSVRAGDVVVANTDMTQKRTVLGSPALVPHTEGDELVFSHHVYALRFASGASHLRPFTYYSLLSPSFRERAEGFATGTTVLALPKEAILGYELVLPPRALLERFNMVAQSLGDLQTLNRAQSRTLAGIRDVLLPTLVEGSCEGIANDAVESLQKMATP